MKTKLNKNIKKHSKKEFENISSKRITIATNINDINFFVINELKKKTSNSKLFIGKVDDKTADKVKKITNINIRNYNISLKGDTIRKIMKSHGSEKTEKPRGQVSVNKNDFTSIDDIILEADNIRLSYKTKDGKPSIIFEKNN